MAGKSTTYVADQVGIVMTSNSKGQIGIRNRFDDIAKKLGKGHALAWLLEHIEQTLWFRALFERNNWAVADTETTGVGAADEICELAIVRPDRVAFSRMLRPTVAIGDGAAGQHGITSEMVEGCPMFSEVQDEIQAAFDGDDDEITELLWYNGAFDIRMIEQTEFSQKVGAAGADWPEAVEVMDRVGVWCGSWNARQGGWRWPKLEGGHRAQGDCEYLIRYLRIMATSDVEYARKLYCERGGECDDG